MDLDSILDGGELRKGPTGDVAVVGRPNVGKSTFINKVIGYHLAAVSTRPQTTRKRWRAIYTDEDCQIVFTDTPGMHQPNDKLGESMHGNIVQQLKVSDVILCIADSYRSHGEEDEMICKTINEVASTKKVVLMINKVDIAKKEDVEETEKFFKERLGDCLVEIIQVSALKNKSMGDVVKSITKHLPTMPFMFDEDAITDAYERDIAAEMIQEAVFQSYQDEVPHQIVVTVDGWKEDEKKIRINSTLYVERESYRKMVLGRDGAKLKKVKAWAIKKLRENIEKRVDLRIYVKVSSDWRNKKSVLRDFGWEFEFGK